MKSGASFRSLSCVLFVLLFSTFSIGQATPRDFHFGSSVETTVALSEQSVFEATINGRGPFKLFFDTGAGGNMLTPEVIAQLGLTPESSQVVVHGISGGKVDASNYRVDEIRIGDLTLTGQNFFSIPMPSNIKGVVGAVGYELMIRLIVKADNEHHQLTFYDPARFVYSGSGEKLELLPDPHELIVHARIGKASGDFILDTGATGYIGVGTNHGFTQQHDLLHHRFHHFFYRGVFSGGADGDASTATLDRIRNLCLGTACVPRVVGEFFDGDDKSPYAGRIGNEILRRFAFTIDWQHHAIYLEKTTHWDKPTTYNQTGLILSLGDGGNALVVDGVYPRSAADKAHIQAGDRILLIDNHPPAFVWYREDHDLAFLRPAGTVITLTIERDNVSQEIEIKLKDIL